MLPTIALIIATGSVLQAGPARPQFRADVQVVKVDVFVTRGRQAVTDLKSHEFEVYDNGISQEVHLLERESVPLTAVLVLDSSASLAGRKLADLQKAVRAFLHALAPNDRVALLAFSSHLEILAGLEDSRETTLEALLKMRAEGATSLHDALYAGLTIGSQNAGSLLLVFTDGRDTFSWLTAGDVVDVVRKTDSLVYAVTTQPKQPVDWQWYAPYGLKVFDPTVGFLDRVASAGGGTVFSLDSLSELEPVLLSILAEMKTRYRLYYYPHGVERPGWHDLKIKVRRRGLKVRARRGYWR